MAVRLQGPYRRTQAGKELFLKTDLASLEGLKRLCRLPTRFLQNDKSGGKMAFNFRQTYLCKNAIDSLKNSCGCSACSQWPAFSMVCISALGNRRLICSVSCSGLM